MKDKMKKFFAVIVGLLLTTGCFAGSVWSFKSGDSSIRYEFFISAEVRNCSGWSVTVNGDTVSDSSSKTVFDDYVVIESDRIIGPDVYYSVNGGTLYLTIK